jgi:hypothetical protein
MNALLQQPPADDGLSPAAGGMLPANVDDPRFAETEAQQGEPARWTARSAFVADLTDGMDASSGDAPVLFWDIVREFLAAVGSALLPR